MHIVTFKMIWPLLVLSISFVSSIDGLKLHEHLTKEEIQSVFQCDHDDVHQVDYEVVKVYHKDDGSASDGVLSKSNPIVHLFAFNKNYTLYLEENDGVLLGDKTPLFLANVNNEGIKYTQMKYPLPENFALYHDVDNRAAVTIQKNSDNKVHVDGIVGDNLIIRPLPARVHEEVLPKHFGIADEQRDFDYSPLQQTAHVVYRPSSDTHNVVSSPTRSTNIRSFNKIKNNFNKILTLRTTYDPSAVTQPSVTTPVSNEETVYPELLITCDYETYTFHGRNLKAVAKYMAAFWNAVDLRFREMTDPKIRLNIAGLIIPQSLNAVSYMNQYVVEENAIEDGKTLDEIGRYFANQTQFPKTMYDIVVGISHRSMGEYTNGTFVNTTTGIANKGYACRRESGDSVALIRDKGGFDSITTAAHEIAHTLNARHDGFATAVLPGGPCPTSDGHLMSYNRHDSRGVHWSHCTISSIRVFLMTRKAQCLKNKPDVGTPYPKLLPGKLMSRDEQCRQRLGMVSYKERESDCAVLWCAKYTSDGEPPTIRLQFRPPAEGSDCTGGGICLDGLCVRNPPELRKNKNKSPIS